MENKQPKMFSCQCCSATFKTNSNMLKHNRTAKHLKLMAKLEAEPTENIQIRNTNSELEKEISILKKHVEELELKLKNKDEIINYVVQVVNKLATKPEAKPEIKPEIKPEVKPQVKPQVKPEVKPEVKPDEPKEEISFHLYKYLKHEDIEFINKNNLNDLDADDMDKLREQLSDNQYEKYTAEEMRNSFEKSFSELTSYSLSKWKYSIKESCREDLECYISTYQYSGKRKSIEIPKVSVEIPMEAEDMETEAKAAEADRLYWKLYHKNREIEIISGKEKEKRINESPNLKEVDAIFLMENEVEYSDIEGIDDIRNNLGDLKWKEDDSKDVDVLVSDILKEAEMYLFVHLCESVPVAKWKNTFREESLSYLKEYVQGRNYIKEAKEKKGRKEWEKMRESR